MHQRWTPVSWFPGAYGLTSVLLFVIINNRPVNNILYDDDYYYIIIVTTNNTAIIIITTLEVSIIAIFLLHRTDNNLCHRGDQRLLFGCV